MAMTGAYASILVEAYMSNVWTDITKWVVTDLTGGAGMNSEKYENRLAAPGNLKFSLNNINGTFTPSSTFQRGTPIRLSVTYAGFTAVKFFGYIIEADPDVGTWGPQRVHVTCQDWLEYASNHVLREIPVQSNRSIGDAVTTLVGHAHLKPELVYVEVSSRLFPAVFDANQKGKKMYGELDDLVKSEYSYAYMDMGGRRLHVESRDSRKNIGELSLLPQDNSNSFLLKIDGTSKLLKIDGSSRLLRVLTQPAEYELTFDDLKIVHGRHIINDVTFHIFPKRVDISLSVIFKLGQPVLLPELGTVEFNIYYRDNLGGGAINALSVVSPVVTTDYLANTLEDGTGTNISSNLVITLNDGGDASGAGSKVKIVNNGGVGWLTSFQVRGFAIYPYDPLEIFAEDIPSKEVRGVRSLAIRQPYSDDTEQARQDALRILDIERDPRNVVIGADFTANASDKLMKSFLHVDIGNLVRIECAKPVVDGYFFVQGYDYKIKLNREINYSWVLKELPQLTPIAVKYSGVSVSRNAILYGVQPRLSQLEQFTLSGWAYLTAVNSNFPFASIYGGSTGWWFFNLVTGKLNFVMRGTPSDGQWTSTNDVLTAHLNSWVHVAMTYDMSNFTANDPIFYVDGTSVAITENNAPSGVADKALTSELILGNMRIVGDALAYHYKGLQKDWRIYNRILSAAEIAELAANENNYDTVPGGLLFHGLFVRDFRYADYVDDPITDRMKVMDRVFEVPGTITYDLTNTTFQVVGKDPTLTSY